MKKFLVSLLFIALLMAAAFLPRAAAVLPGPVQVPDPLSADNPRYPESAAEPPSPGESFSDPGLGASCTRVTGDSGMRHEYARFDPFNADKSLVVLFDFNNGAYGVYRTEIPYDAPGNLLCRLDMEEPRWDPEDPYTVTGLNGSQILRADVKTGDTAVVKDFALDPVIGPVIAAESDLYRVTTKGEGECSLDGRWWALALQGSEEDYGLQYLFTWDRDTDTVPGVFAVNEGAGGIDWVGMSPKGTWVVIGCEYDNAFPLTGTVIADREFSQFHRINYDVAHSDVGLDSAGHEVLVMQNTRTDHIDMILLDPSTRAITGSDDSSYGYSGHIPLVRLNYENGSPLAFSSGIHISCNAPGWALISAFTAPDAPEKNWLDKSIALVRLDPAAPEAFLIAKTHNLTGDYWEETHGTITRDGKTVLWTANFGRDPGAYNLFLLRLDLP